jgi:GNAT superfamily N-acetyltransferase
LEGGDETVVEIEQVGSEALGQYAEIPIAFEVKSVLRVEPLDGGLGGFRLREEAVVPPYVKDYDAYEEGGPEGWPTRFSVDEWGFYLAWENGRCVGGAAAAYGVSGMHMLEGQGDLAVLWDIRVERDARGCGIGRRLFEHAADWARRRGCTRLKAETQNVNVPACRFYAAQGCELGAIHRYGYAGVPLVAHEAMLLWYLEL